MPIGHGSTSENGGYVKEKPVSPADLSATVLQRLGIDPQQTWGDEFQNLPRKLRERGAGFGGKYELCRAPDL